MAAPRVRAVLLGLLAPALVAASAAGEAATAASAKEAQAPEASGQASGGGGSAHEVLASVQHLMSLWRAPEPGFLVADVRNITVLAATVGCMTCCGSGDCSHAYMDTNAGQCCSANPPSCCPLGTTCSGSGCVTPAAYQAASRAGYFPAAQTSQPYSTPGIPDKPTIFVLIMVGVVLLCLCQLCAGSQPGGIGGMLCGGPFLAPCYSPCFRIVSPCGTPYAQPYGGFGAPIYQPGVASPVYGGYPATAGYPVGGYPVAGYGGGDVALAGGAGFLGGLGLGYVLGES